MAKKCSACATLTFSDLALGALGAGASVLSANFLKDLAAGVAQRFESPSLSRFAGAVAPVLVGATQAGAAYVASKVVDAPALWIGAGSMSAMYATAKALQALPLDIAQKAGNLFQLAGDDRPGLQPYTPEELIAYYQAAALPAPAQDVSHNRALNGDRIHADPLAGDRHHADPLGGDELDSDNYAMHGRQYADPLA